MVSTLSAPLRRAAAVVMCSGVLAGGLVTLAAAPANATTNLFQATTSTALVDSATPRASDVDPTTLPVGTHVDANGRRHTTKAYFTFDVSPLLGHEVLSASFQVPETAVADCSMATVPQAWLTGPATAPTFTYQPRELIELTGPGQPGACPDSLPLAWDATQAIRRAVAHGSRTATIEVRLADADQPHPARGITLDPAAHLLLTYNVLPTTPTDLSVGGRACAGTPVFVPSNFPGIVVTANVTDPDDPGLTVEFDWWPVADPTQRSVIDEPAVSGLTTRATIPLSALADGTTYAFQARGIDDNQTGQETVVDGPFSAVCQFTTDFTPPGTAPTVTSTDYPSGVPAGGVGVPGTFTFSGNGDPDVAGFVIQPAFGNVIPADHPGGTASVQITPTSFGPKSLTVLTVDEVGNIGPSTTYRYFVASNAPTVTCDPESAFLGQPIQCTFTDSDAITGYTYQLDGDTGASTVAADERGSATVTITPTAQFTNGVLRVTAQLANGNASAPALELLQIDTGAPTVDQSATQVAAGTPVTFTFHAVLPDTTSFTYTVSGNPTTVPAGPDGTATVTVVPTHSLFLEVFGTTAAGVQSAPTDVFVGVS